MQYRLIVDSKEQGKFKTIELLKDYLKAMVLSDYPNAEVLWPSNTTEVYVYTK